MVRFIKSCFGEPIKYPIFHWYLIEVGQRAMKLGVDKIFFLSREGIWLTDQYEKLRLRARQPGQYPRACHLAVSRFSTYLPSFHSVEAAISDFRRGQYKNASERALMSSLGHEGEGDPVIHLERRRVSQREALTAYLNRHGISERERVLVADIGWRGSIQDNLARLYPDNLWLGYYFHLQPFFSEQAENVRKKEVLIPEGSRTVALLRRLRFGAPLEFLLTDRSGAVIGYDIVDGTSIPNIEQKKDLFGPEVWSQILSLRATMEQMASHWSLDTISHGKRALDETIMLLERPHRSVYEPYFAAQRDERFGSGEMLSSDRLAATDLIVALLSAERRQSAAEKLATSGWPWALLQRDVPHIAPVIRRLLIALDVSLSKRG
ncbi:hypothetical protein [Agrobacterium sp. MS2]|uniref:hypothetical protein n=1 Tax=Agrobacterium sp. MS2 TaxID=1345498 RepID=UPI000DC03EDE|nr:hypothetical protein [Agrobacterium sp. MS2]RAL97224.1 hypothetical protein DOU54_13595 [Agrobacterium sp. MS2]